VREPCPNAADLAVRPQSAPAPGHAPVRIGGLFDLQVRSLCVLVHSHSDLPPSSLLCIALERRAGASSPAAPAFSGLGLAGLLFVGDQTYVIMFCPAHFADWNIFPLLICEDRRNVCTLYVHGAAINAVYRPVIDDSFVVKTLHDRHPLMRFRPDGPEALLSV